MNKQRLYWVDMLRILEDEKSQEQLQKIEITKNKIIATICVIGLGLAILPLIIASFSNHLYADDYSYGCNGMNILNQNLGLIETIQKLIGNAIITTYDQWYNWSGCYTSFFFSSISPGIFGDEWIFVNVFILLGSFVLSNYIGFRIFLGDILKVDKIKVLQLFCVVTFISIQFVPSIPQAFYWFNGAFYNIVGYSLGLLQFAFVLKLLFKKEISYVHRNGIATILIGILFGGTNYSCILLYMVIYLYLFIFYFKRNIKKSVINMLY